jgi:prolyl 4-hydroxylase
MPRRGRLLLWPSVLDEDLNMKDFSTEHQALPVEAGEKYGANGWLHLRDFTDSLGKGCI